MKLSSTFLSSALVLTEFQYAKRLVLSAVTFERVQRYMELTVNETVINNLKQP